MFDNGTDQEADKTPVQMALGGHPLPLQICSSPASTIFYFMNLIWFMQDYYKFL